VPENGLHIIVEVFRKHPDTTLVVVGFDPHKDGYAKRLAENAPPDVHFIGAKCGREHDVLSVGSIAQIRSSLNDSEGRPPATIDAMGFGLGVIASDVPQHRRAFGEAVIYFDPRDVDTLGQAIESVFNRH